MFTIALEALDHAVSQGKLRNTRKYKALASVNAVVDGPPGYQKQFTKELFEFIREFIKVTIGQSGKQNPIDTHVHQQ